MHGEFILYGQSCTGFFDLALNVESKSESDIRPEGTEGRDREDGVGSCIRSMAAEVRF